MILSYENIEHIAAGVAKDFCCAIHAGEKKYEICLLYTSDAADEL